MVLNSKIQIQTREAGPDGGGWVEERNKLLNLKLVGQSQVFAVSV